MLILRRISRFKLKQIKPLYNKKKGHFKILTMIIRNNIKLFIMLNILALSSILALSAEISGEAGILTDKNYTLEVFFTAQTAGGMTIKTEASDDKNYLAFEVAKKSIVLKNVQNNKSKQLAKINISLDDKQDYQLSFIRRGDRLIVTLDGVIKYTGQNIPNGGGDKFGAVYNKWETADIYAATADPVYFSDDFMRDYTDDDGLWDIKSGYWRMRSAWDNDPHLFATSKNFTKKIAGGQNPFSWLSWGGPAIAVIGENDWEDYTFSVAFRAYEGGTFGIIINYQDEKNYLLATASSAIDKSEKGNKLTLYKVEKGKKTVLNSSKGGYLPDQWYKFSVKNSADGIKILLDGKERITVKDAPSFMGRAGLYTDTNSPIEIDDVWVLGSGVDFNALLEITHFGIGERFEKDPNGMQSWASAAKNWGTGRASSILTPPSVVYVYARNVYGDKQWMVFDIAPGSVKENEENIINMYLATDRDNTENSYRMELNTKNNESSVKLYQNETLLAETTIKTRVSNGLLSQPKDEEKQYLLEKNNYTLRFMKDNDILIFTIGNDEILRAKIPDTKKTTGYKPAYFCSGRYKIDAKNVLVLSDNYLDYTFSEAPTDWMSEGTWESSTRWACDPEWSFLAGYSNGKLGLWNKNTFKGDHLFQAYLGIKMEYEREYDTYYERYRDLGISICTDGVDPMSGYAGVYGAENGTKMKLYRNGDEVASYDYTNDRSKRMTGDHHNIWYDLTLEKQGNKIVFTGKVSDRDNTVTVLTYEDPEPIDGGVPVIWSKNNGISVARARLTYNHSEPRIGPFNVVELPHYPEFISVAEPLKLPIRAFSTADHEVELTVNATALPEDAKNKPSTVKIKDGNIVFSPNFTGHYQYEIKGIAASAVSPSVYIDTLVFNPTQRDRTTENAIVRYNFTEGQGNIIHDVSGYGEPLNLIISDIEEENGGSGTLSATWLEEQGIAVNALSRIVSDGAATKIFNALKENKAFTIEMWVSLATIYPENPQGVQQWSCGYLEFSDPEGKDSANRMFSLMQNGGGFFIDPKSASSDRRATPDFRQEFKGFDVRVGLQHIVISYDPSSGNTMTFRGDGVKFATVKSEKNIDWKMDNWSNDKAKLILGNSLMFLKNQTPIGPGLLTPITTTTEQKPSFAAPFSGKIYYLAIYNRTMSEAEAKANFYAGPHPEPKY